ncbi:MAG TPA: M14 family metallopeptidase [Thermoanaerobaculia bacterium]|nr:M14 family metallopeptidase [Thermoanaerobaculia bacterium]
MNLRHRLSTCLLCAVGLGAASPALAGSARETPILPPLPPWSGKTRVLALPASHPWVTPSEASGFRTTPTYDETVAWLKRLDAASPELALVSLGKSPQGRDLWLAIASLERATTPEALAATGKPMLFAQAGIHSGEIDGKDAGLMLLRDLLVTGTKRALLERANFLFVPILSVDAHERASRFSRVNQRGPEVSGWRTTARNLNLNRDYAKLDALELRLLVAALDRYQPDLYFDLHVTDGADYQYDITYGTNSRTGHSPAIAGWMAEQLIPALDRDLEAAGHVPGPLIFLQDETDPTKGNVRVNTGVRLSHGYGDARHLASLLVENHSLKPYDQRVLGTYVLLESALRELGRSAPALRRATAEDRGRQARMVTLDWVPRQGTPATFEMKAVASRLERSRVTGRDYVVWTGQPLTVTVPWLDITQPGRQVAKPRAYWVPPTWPEVIERLRLHGVRFEVIPEPREVEVEMVRLTEAQLGDQAFEGRVTVTATPLPERRREWFPAGSARVPTDQPLGDLAVLLLEPASPDSFFQWGFFHELLQRTEYVEAYVMEPMAAAMLAQDPALAAAFEKRLTEDAAFAADPRARLQWFYERTPFYDERYLLYPVGRE